MAANTTAQPTAAEEAGKVFASTEICAEANRLLEIECKREDRSRAYLLRNIIHAWARKQPGAAKKEIA
jgi:hypothetical protein